MRKSNVVSVRLQNSPYQSKTLSLTKTGLLKNWLQRASLKMKGRGNGNRFLHDSVSEFVVIVLPYIICNLNNISQITKEVSAVFHFAKLSEDCFKTFYTSGS